jgi:hypothetical protein
VVGSGVGPTLPTALFCPRGGCGSTRRTSWLPRFLFLRSEFEQVSVDVARDSTFLVRASGLQQVADRAEVFIDVSAPGPALIHGCGQRRLTLDNVAEGSDYAVLGGANLRIGAVPPVAGEVA